MSQQPSPLPSFYYIMFRWYEPLLTAVGFVGTWLDPKSTHDGQALWPVDSPPPAVLPRATVVTTLQLAHVCFLLGMLNFFALGAIRKHLHFDFALQERLLTAYFTPLMMGDILHIYITLIGQGPDMWVVEKWTPMVRATVVLGLSLMLPRMAWFAGVGRYVSKRDGVSKDEKQSKVTS